MYDQRYPSSGKSFRMKYLRGEQNTIADALSRFPLLGPQKLRTEGHAKALDVLLAAIARSTVSVSRLWFNAGKDTDYLLPAKTQLPIWIRVISEAN